MKLHVNVLIVYQPNISTLIKFNSLVFIIIIHFIPVCYPNIQRLRFIEL